MRVETDRGSRILAHGRDPNYPGWPIRCSSTTLPAWPGNFTSEGFVSYAWAGKDQGRYVAVMNYADHRGQCYLRLPFPELQEGQLLLTDLMGSEVYHRDGGDLVHRGLYIDQAPWQINVFELRSISAAG